MTFGNYITLNLQKSEQNYNYLLMYAVTHPPTYFADIYINSLLTFSCKKSRKNWTSILLYRSWWISFVNESDFQNFIQTSFPLRKSYFFLVWVPQISMNSLQGYFLRNFVSQLHPSEFIIYLTLSLFHASLFLYFFFINLVEI